VVNFAKTEENVVMVQKTVGGKDLQKAFEAGRQMATA
jgi:hypothetical protein